MLDCRNYILIPARNEEIGEAVQKSFGFYSESISSVGNSELKRAV